MKKPNKYFILKKDGVYIVEWIVNTKLARKLNPESDISLCNNWIAIETPSHAVILGAEEGFTYEI